MPYVFQVGDDGRSIFWSDTSEVYNPWAWGWTPSGGVICFTDLRATKDAGTQGVWLNQVLANGGGAIGGATSDAGVYEAFRWTAAVGTYASAGSFGAARSLVSAQPVAPPFARGSVAPKPTAALRPWSTA